MTRSSRHSLSRETSSWMIASVTQLSPQMKSWRIRGPSGRVRRARTGAGVEGGELDDEDEGKGAFWVWAGEPECGGWGEGLGRERER